MRGTPGDYPGAKRARVVERDSTFARRASAASACARKSDSTCARCRKYSTPSATTIAVLPSSHGSVANSQSVMSPATIGRREVSAKNWRRIEITSGRSTSTQVNRPSPAASISSKPGSRPQPRLMHNPSGWPSRNRGTVPEPLRSEHHGAHFSSVEIKHPDRFQVGEVSLATGVPCTEDPARQSRQAPIGVPSPRRSIPVITMRLCSI